MNSARKRAWSVHLFTASGVLMGVWALDMVWAGRIQAAFFFMMLAVAIDSVDGSLARRWRVEQILPQIDGRRLDDMVDFFTWVIVPVLAMSVWGWLPPLVWAVPLLCSALGMANQQAKTDDDAFLGFPSLWNVVAIYLWRWNLGPALNGLIVILLSLAVLAPVKFIYPSKTKSWPRLNQLLMTLWGLLVVLSLVGPEEHRQTCLAWSNLYPIYYVLASFWLHWKSRITRTNQSV
jgi:phosphatidylcholine synthase